MSSGVITTVAGIGGSGYYSGDGGQATSATLYFPVGVAVDSSGNFLQKYIAIITYLFRTFTGNIYIADTYNGRVRKVTISTGVMTTIAGTGIVSYSGDGGAATSATLGGPTRVALDSSGIPSSNCQPFKIIIMFCRITRQRVHR